MTREQFEYWMTLYCLLYATAVTLTLLYYLCRALFSSKRRHKTITLSDELTLDTIIKIKACFHRKHELAVRKWLDENEYEWNAHPFTFYANLTITTTVRDSVKLIEFLK